MSVFQLKEGDTSPSLSYALSPTSIDLTGASVVFNMMDRRGTVKVNRAAATITTATGTPTVQYDWQAADTDTAGVYRGEFEVTYADTTVETFPNGLAYIPVIIGKDIA